MSRFRTIAAIMVWSGVLAGPASSGTRYLRPLKALGAGDHPVVQSLAPDMPAEKAGVSPGDTLLQVDNVALSDSRQLAEHMRQLGKQDSVDLLIGRPAGRVVIRVAHDKQSHRLGVNILGASLTDTLAALVTPNLTVSLNVAEFGDGTWARADIRNSGGDPIEFGPDSVTVIDGNGAVQAAITPQELLALKFGGSVTNVAGATHLGMGDAIASGIMSGWAQGTREQYTRSVMENALHESRIPPDSRYGGALFYAVKQMQKPVRVRVSVGGRLFEAEFGEPKH